MQIYNSNQTFFVEFEPGANQGHTSSSRNEKMPLSLKGAAISAEYFSRLYII